MPLRRLVEGLGRFSLPERKPTGRNVQRNGELLHRADQRLTAAHLNDKHTLRRDAGGFRDAAQCEKVLQTPGYDTYSGLLFLPPAGIKFLPVPERPTRGEIESAKHWLHEAVHDFPFEKRAHRSAWMVDNLYREIERACDHVGVARFSLNDCRRTFASWMLQGGAPLFDVAKLLGHRSIAMVQQVYGHLSDESLRRAVDKLPTSAHASRRKNKPES